LGEAKGYIVGCIILYGSGGEMIAECSFDRTKLSSLVENFVPEAISLTGYGNMILLRMIGLSFVF